MPRTQYGLIWPNYPDPLTFEQAAEILQVSDRWIRREGTDPNKGGIPVTPLGRKTNQRRIRQAALAAWLEEQERIGVDRSQFGRAALSKRAAVRRAKKKSQPTKKSAA